MTETSKTIVDLINGIISHGNHKHSTYSLQAFSDMRLLAALEQTETIDDEDTELIDLYEIIESEADTDDFTLDFDGNEYRIINDDVIWSIYVETIQETVLDCYGLDKIPGFVEIDWEQTAKNCYYDGYGFTFATYDNEESEAGGFWIFRTN